MAISYKNSSRKNPADKTIRPKNRDSKRQPMLNLHRIQPFKYDMREVLETSKMDPSVATSFLASLIAKASRNSVREAKEYAKTFLDTGELEKEDLDRISRLLDRYSKYR
ncbi:MAG: hypothetical protein PHW93_04295 [Candidatus Methanomethylophilaceae archaeon]|nr:hypothetical protein [Candidatus Methanomethylophilaceae archaeon]